MLPYVTYYALWFNPFTHPEYWKPCLMKKQQQHFSSVSIAFKHKKHIQFKLRQLPKQILLFPSTLRKKFHLITEGIYPSPKGDGRWERKRKQMDGKLRRKGKQDLHAINHYFSSLLYALICYAVYGKRCREISPALKVLHKQEDWEKDNH